MQSRLAGKVGKKWGWLGVALGLGLVMVAGLAAGEDLYVENPPYNFYNPYTISGGTQTYENVYVGNNTSAVDIRLNGGTLAVAGEEYMGRYYGSGFFTQNGGSHTVGGNLHVGSFNKEYNTMYLLNDGTLTVAVEEFIGGNYHGEGTGKFIQSGGSHSVGRLSLNHGSTYSLQGGILTVAEKEIIGEYLDSCTFTQSGGSHSVGNLSLGGGSTYRLQDGSLAVTGKETIGGIPNSRDGFTQVGGTHTVTGTLQLDTYSKYNFSGGSLRVGSLELKRAATFKQSTGSIKVDDLLRFEDGATYEMDSGSISANTISISDGTFIQRGGTKTVAVAKEVKVSGFGNPTYDFNGSLWADSISIGRGTFTQSGGTNYSQKMELLVGGVYNQIAGTNTVGNLIVNGGKYDFRGGKFSGDSISISGRGTFTQSGGTIYSQKMELLSGIYTQTDGINSFGNLIVNGGKYDFRGGKFSAHDINIIYNGIFNYNGTLVNNNTFTIDDGTFSGDLENRGEAYLKNGVFQGRLLNYGSAFVNGVFTVDDLLQTASATPITIGNNQSLTIKGELTNNGAMTLERNGALTAKQEKIGDGGIGTFTQNGGTHSVGSLFLGINSGSSGTYVLKESPYMLLEAEKEYIGYGGTGTFTQSGGTHSVQGVLLLGKETSGSGTYDLIDGSLSVAGDEDIGHMGTGTFTQSGGTHSVQGTLHLGKRRGGSGTYKLLKGSLAVAGDEYIGYGNTGTFIQEDGTHTVTGSLTLGGGTGAYSLSGGSLTAKSIVLDRGGTFTQTGGNLSATQIFLDNRSTFIQTGGTLDFTSFSHGNGTATFIDLYLGRNPGDKGTYHLSYGGTVKAVNEWIGLNGTGTFIQEDGTHMVTGSLTLGGSGTGTYSLSGGSLMAADIVLKSGGTFTQTGGTLAITGNSAEGNGLLNLKGGVLQASGGAHTLGNDLKVNDDYTIGGSNDLTLRGAVELAKGATTVVNSANTTFTNVISGAGRLVQNSTGGAGTLTLSEANTYTGGTTLTKGILMAGASSFAGGTAGPFGPDAAVLNLAGGALAAAGTARTITNTTINMNGDFALGTSAANHNLTLGQAAGVFNLGAGTSRTVTVNNTTQIDSVVTGAGSSLTKTGEGTLILTGPNTYNGSTTVQAGTLILRANGVLSGDVTVNRATFTNYSIPAQSVVGSTTINNGGTYRLTLAGPCDNGDITLTTGGTLNMSGIGTYNSAVTNHGGTVMLEGIIALNKPYINEPGSTYIISPLSTVTITGGETNSGTMDVNGTLTGNLTNNAGGTVGGTGTITGNLANNGMVNPGNSIGTLTIKGNYSQSSQGKLLIEVASTSSNDVLAITGSADLNGALQTSWSGGYTPAINTKFGTILTASSGVAGQFSSLLTNITPTLLFKPRYDVSNQVYLVVERDYANQNLLPYLSPNQRAIASMLNSVGNNATGDLNTVLTALDALPSYGLTAYAIDLLAPKGTEASSGMGISGVTFQTGNLSERLSDLRQGIKGMSMNGLYFKNGNGMPVMLASVNPDHTGMLPAGVDERWGFFVKGNAVYGDQKDRPDVTGYDFTNMGITIGSDYRFTKSFIAGFMLGLNTSRANVDSIGSKVKMDGYNLGTYGTYYKDNFYIDGSLSWGLTNYDNTRRIVFPGIDRTATSSPDGNQLTLYGGTGYDFRKNNWIITPNMSLQYAKLNINSYTESGAGALNLDVDKQNTESLQGNIGGRLSCIFKTDRTTLIPSIRISYGYEFLRDSQNITSRLVQGSSPFSIETLSPDRSSLTLGAGISAFNKDNISVYINYDAQIGESRYIAHSVNAGLRVGF